ncbi:MAG: radical SAM protein, partial [Deltaproteobacteria bacterium]|nr:radical SAM protein [Deltaproteobacteria bacterium]
MTWSVVNAYRHLLAMESGAVVKDWGGKVPMALVFPNTYHAGMSNLGFQSMYRLFNIFPDVVCGRVFLPDPELTREYIRTGTPLLSLENQRPVGEFELIAFSLSFENDYPNVLKMLTLSRLGRRRDQRSETDPLILAGGVAMRSNPEPLAEFLDLVLIGDGEAIAAPLIRAWCDVRLESLPKKERLLHLARNVPGAYAPAWYEAAFDPKGRLASFQPTHHQIPAKVRPARASDLPRPALTTQVLTPSTEFADTRLVEIGRGCPHGCRFCLAGFVYRPPRYQPRDIILETLGAAQKPGERIGLVGPSVADHPEIELLIRDLLAQGREVTVSSLRAEALTTGMIQDLARGRLKGAAIAPEAGSQRLRDLINKRLTETQILQGTETLAKAGRN